MSPREGRDVGYLEQEAIEMAGRSVLDEVLSVAEDVNSLEHRIRVLEEELETAETGEDAERLLAEYGRLQDRFEHLGGYTLESRRARGAHRPRLQGARSGA